MKKFELFICCLGNGTTICNKAVTEHGDYKTIAHISEHGAIEFYVSADYIPADAIQKIKQLADVCKSKFLEKWNRKNYLQKWEYMMDIPTIGCGYNAIQLVNKENKHLPLADRVPLMEKVFFETQL